LKYNLVRQGNKLTRYVLFRLFAIDPKYFDQNGHNQGPHRN